MNARELRATVVFVALAIAGLGLVVIPQAGAVDALPRILAGVGSALFAAALAFFLVDMTASRRGA